MKTRKGFNKWVEKLPIPYNYKKVEEIDKKWERMKKMHGIL